jgi:hypothetical protein
MEGLQTNTFKEESVDFVANLAERQTLAFIVASCDEYVEEVLVTPLRFSQ